MSYKCEILTDSLSPNNNRLTTFKVTYPRIIHAEMLRHRMFSRNVASSRAIPFKKMVKDVEEHPFIPIAWQKDHKGMQGTEYFTNSDDIRWNNDKWLAAKNNAIASAKYLAAGFPDDETGIGVTKQICNRLLEPFVWITELITTSEEGLQNFFGLRCPQYTIIDNDKAKNLTFKSRKDLTNWELNNSFEYTHLHNSEIDWLKCNISQAEIHIQAIAELMWDAYNESKPKDLKAGEWHTPFGDGIKFNSGSLIGSELWDDNKETFLDFVIRQAIKVATARCARISYETLGDNPKIDYEADIKLHDILMNSKHWSPFEHCARVMNDEEYNSFTNTTMEYDYEENYYAGAKVFKGCCRNFKGFIQYRHLVET